jgi:nucleotide-binding universal stress UspA family protein
VVRRDDRLEERGDANHVLTFYGRHSDLTILGQLDSHDPAQRAARVTPELIVLGTGQPVLMVPFAGTFKSAGDRILVAWNASAQASRAIRDAMPFLVRAKEVTVLVVNLEAGIDSTSADLIGHLKHHGVKAELDRRLAEGAEVGDLLLSCATQKSADLIVMGAYGHSRVRELVLGGVSRYMLAHMIVPVLMSH